MNKPAPKRSTAQNAKTSAARLLGFKVIKTNGKAVSPDLIKASNQMKKGLATVQEESKVMAW